MSFYEGILTAAAPCALHRQNTPASGYFSSHRPLRAAPFALDDTVANLRFRHSERSEESPSTLSAIAKERGRPVPLYSKPPSLKREGGLLTSSIKAFHAHENKCAAAQDYLPCAPFAGKHSSSSSARQMQ